MSVTITIIIIISE